VRVFPAHYRETEHITGKLSTLQGKSSILAVHA